MHLPALQHGTKWIIGSGRLVNLWHDQWILNASLSSLFPSINFAYPSPVASLVLENSWFIPPTFPPEVRNLILDSLQDIPPPNQDCNDQPVWMDSTSGILSLTSA